MCVNYIAQMCGEGTDLKRSVDNSNGYQQRYSGGERVRSVTISSHCDRSACVFVCSRVLLPVRWRSGLHGVASNTWVYWPTVYLRVATGCQSRRSSSFLLFKSLEIGSYHSIVGILLCVQTRIINNTIEY